MTQEHPIASPSEGLVLQWSDEWYKAKVKHMNREKYMCMQAAQWGADQELEACCEWLETGPYGFSIEATAPSMTKRLRAARRPESLKKQALALINHEPEKQPFLGAKSIAIIRRALESLPD
jgi:hypothetical protein